VFPCFLCGKLYCEHTYHTIEIWKMQADFLNFFPLIKDAVFICHGKINTAEKVFERKRGVKRGKGDLFSKSLLSPFLSSFPFIFYKSLLDLT
ncbi:MAG: hypothetical protein IKC08_05280, partial [Lentisphaeria bacterium]|nr:hypothetical protein [Lentisphaeria bacterium]